VIEVSRQALVAALEPCAKVADQRSTMAILANVLLDAKSGQLKFRATNLRHEVSGSLPAAGSGAFGANASKLLAAVGSLDGDTVQLELKKNSLTVKGSGARKFKLQTVAAEEFPTAMSVTGTRVEFGDGELQRLIRSTVWSVATDTTRPMLCSVQLKGGSGKAVASTTDGISMARLAVDSKSEFEVNLPAEVAKLVQSATGAIALEHCGPAIAFTAGGVKIACTQPEGHFPPLDYVISSIPEPIGRATVSAAALRESVRAIRRSSDDVRIRFTAGAIELFSLDKDDESEDAIECECRGDGEVWIPGTVLMSALGVVDGDVELALPGELMHPVAIRQGGYTAFVMQRREDHIRAKA